MPNWIALYWTTWSQTKAFSAKSSHEDKREKTAQMKFTGTIFLFWTLSIISFVKET
jgi:hypothetical protein